ncbi:WLM domain-containing protein [Russula compacta]|nr:WLM domain-containing protein [Russula compacta]
MVHLRLNEHETNPNPHVNFITALPIADPHEQERARQLLRALAAQVRPVMKAHGFVVNSLEEYEYNDVFAGRNWNNGETVELVLRGRDGSFVSTSWLIGTLCHELAHIKYMNHGPDFQALWSQLRKEVIALQAKGYYGDGMWSSGTRLADSSKIVSGGRIEDDLPEYMCGGAQRRARPSARRRRQRPVAGPSMLTGAQTSKRRKAGSRVTDAGTFSGSGQALNADEDEKTTGTGFRKKAGSKRAREERALAAERRLFTLQASTNPTQRPEEDDSDIDAQELPETNSDRRQAMMTSMDASEVDQLRTGTLSDFWGDFILPKRQTGEGHDAGSTATRDDGPPLGNVARTRSENRQITKWSCLVCTLDNDPDHLACSACATPRGDTHWRGSVH